jgi:hypothetical protein
MIENGSASTTRSAVTGFVVPPWRNVSAYVPAGFKRMATSSEPIVIWLATPPGARRREADR